MADFHGTIFVSCDKLTTGLRHGLRLACTSEKKELYVISWENERLDRGN